MKIDHIRTIAVTQGFAILGGALGGAIIGDSIVFVSAFICAVLGLAFTLTNQQREARA